MGARHEALQVADQCRTLVKKVLTAASIRTPCHDDVGHGEPVINEIVVLGQMGVPHRGGAFEHLGILCQPRADAFILGQHVGVDEGIRQPCFHFSQAERNPLVVLGAGERARLGNQIRIGDTIGDVGTNGRGFEQIPAVDARHRYLGQGVKLPQFFPAGQVIAIDEGVFNAGFVQCPLVGLMPANR